MLRKFDRLIHLLCNLAMWISVFTLVAIVLLNISNLFLRWFMNLTIDWVLEISLILFVYSVMLIVPIIYHDKNFIQMHLIEEIISKRASKSLNLIVDVIILAFLVYLLSFSIGLSASQIHMLSRGLGVPRMYITLPISIAVALSLLVSISNIIHKSQDLRSKT